MRLSRSASLPRHWIHSGIAAILLAMPATAHAAWPPDPTTNVALCTTTSSSQVSAAVPDGKGGAIVAWYEDRNADFDVFVRRVTDQGVPLWTANGVKVCTAPIGTAQILPKAVSDGLGGALVVWMDGRNGPQNLYAQRVDSLGNLAWAPGGVLVATTNTAQVTSFSVAADGSNGIVVTWDTPANGISSDIWAQRLNAAGVAQWGASAKSVCADRFDQQRPVVVRKASGVFVIAWEDLRLTFRSDIYAQALTNAGATQWTRDGIPLAASADNASNPMLLASGADDCLLLWDADSLGIGEIRGQRVGPTGTFLWQGIGQRLTNPGLSGLMGAASDDSSGAYFVFNAIEGVQSKLALRVGRVRADGQYMFQLTGKRVCGAGSNQTQAAVTSDGTGGVLMTWYDDQRGLSPASDVLAQRVNRVGNLLWSGGGVPVCRAPNNTGPGLVVTRGVPGGAVVAWSDTRNSTSPDLYVQGIDALGRLGVGLGVEPPAEPVAVALARPAPNPAPSGRTAIAYTLTQSERVQLRVVDPSGRVVAVLEDGVREPGTHRIAWDGRAHGQSLPPGLYLVQLLTPTRSEIRRLVLL